MRHEHERARPRRQEFLKPTDGREIEVIGRFVEEQQVGLRDQFAGQQSPPLEPGRHRPDIGGGVDLHSFERASGPLVRFPAFDLVGRHGGVEGLPHDGQSVAGEVLRHLLREIGNAGARSHHASSPIGLLLPGDHPEKCGLAGAIAAEKTDPLSGLDLPGDAIEERRPAVADREVVEVNEGHACPGKRGGRRSRILPNIDRTHRTHRP